MNSIVKISIWWILVNSICAFANDRYIANPYRYPETSDPTHPIHNAVKLHRTVKNCSDDKIVKSEEIIKLQRPDGTRYANYVCRSRKVEQCTGIDRNGKYYDEWCEDTARKRIKLPVK